jgi:hypothetical protein
MGSRQPKKGSDSPIGAPLFLQRRALEQEAAERRDALARPDLLLSQILVAQPEQNIQPATT